MKTLSCHEVSGLTCPYVAKGETNEEVMARLKKHGQEAHPAEIAVLLENMPEEEMMNLMKSKIKDE